MFARGRLKGNSPEGFELLRMQSKNLDPCGALSKSVHGFEHTNELWDALKLFTLFVALREGRVVADKPWAGGGKRRPEGSDSWNWLVNVRTAVFPFADPSGMLFSVVSGQEATRCETFYTLELIKFLSD